MEVFVRETSKEKEYVIQGDFTFADEDAFFDVFMAVRSQTEPTVVFNLSKCSFIDSAGLGMLLVAFEEGAKRCLNQVIRDVPDDIKEELVLAGLNRYFRFQNKKNNSP